MSYCPVDGDPDPKARGPQETPDKPGPNDEVGGAAGRIECGVEVGRAPARPRARVHGRASCRGGLSAISATPLPRYPLQIDRFRGAAKLRYLTTPLPPLPKTGPVIFPFF